MKEGRVRRKEKMVERSRLDRPETEKSVKTQAPDSHPLFLTPFLPKFGFCSFSSLICGKGD